MRNVSAINDGDVLENLAMSVGDEAADVVLVTVTAAQGRGYPPADIPPIVGWISTQADGSDVAATVPDGGIAISGSVGTLTEHVADAVFTLQLNDGGKAIIAVTESGGNDFYVVLVKPDDGTLLISDKCDFTA